MEWHFVVLGEGRVGRIASRNEAYDAAGHTERGSPNGAINRTRANAIEWYIDPLVLCRIHRLIDIYKRVTLAVAVGVEDERSPTLRLLFVLGLEVHPGVEETFDYAAAREPQNIFIVQIQMMRSEAGVDGRDLFGFRIVDLNLPSALNDWKCLGRGMIGPFAAERHGLILANSRGDPHAALFVHGEAVGVRLARPDRFVTPIWRGLHGFRVAFARCLRIVQLLQRGALIRDREEQREQRGALRLVMRQLEIARKLAGDFFRHMTGNDKAGVGVDEARAGRGLRLVRDDRVEDQLAGVRHR